MGLFSRKRRRTEPYGLWSDDAQQWETFLARGADAGAERNLEVSLSFANEEGARAAAKELGQLREPGELVPPSHGVEEWGILLYRRDAVMVPDVLREAIDVGERIAEAHGGECEGWTAFYTAEEKAAWGVELLDGL
ncbi:ribonuclease E inhibitor RraB [Demequina sp. B12]|uniref:ribonuclease E inhibitor RraB n=1 Tax=Demequina sp. B12 TaxID=2992757 RepID=UPI00237BE102|nr:ribonuclease E inhibitor RraB [Demequina sp. B12]MDE0573486.1 ribonuclease E inhibitor RraB [Demequina sp. B12]